MSDPLFLFARIVPKPEHLSDARQAVLDIVPATLAEPGCQMFVLHDDREGVGALYLYESWSDEAALAAHYDQPYTRAVFAQYESWLAAPVEVTKLRRLA